MKKLVIPILFITAACAASAGAHAELLVPKGTKARLDVDYIYTSEGNYFSSSKDTKRNWKSRRVVHISADYVADAVQPFGAMHASDTRQQQDIKTAEAKGAELYAKHSPMAADMYKIAEECKYEEKCIEKKVSTYADNMAKPTDIAATQAKITELSQGSGPRFQLWRSVSQRGTYDVNDLDQMQIYEMTCTDAKVCKRTVTTTGGGPLPAPAGGRGAGGASMFEVDGQGKDLVVALPVVLAPMKLNKTVETSIPNDPTRSDSGFLPLGKVQKTDPIIVKLPNGTVEASGQQKVKIEGDYMEGGTLMISWKLSLVK